MFDMSICRGRFSSPDLPQVEATERRRAFWPLCCLLLWSGFSVLVVCKASEIYKLCLYHLHARAGLACRFGVLKLTLHDNDLKFHSTWSTYILLFRMRQCYGDMRSTFHTITLQKCSSSMFACNLAFSPAVRRTDLSL